MANNMPKTEETNVYMTLGASATKSEVHAAIKKQDKGIFPGAFCKLIADPCGDENFCAAMHADGAGTKSSLAYIKYKETGDLTALENIAIDSIAMNVDDLLCIGAVGGFVMSNTIGRNAHRVGGEAIAAVIRGYENIVEKLADCGVDILMSGGETADVGDLVGTLICDSTFFVRLPRKDVIDCDNIKPGNVIVGLASYGQATYENSYNAGMGSNGLTAARHLLLCNEYAEKYPETYSGTLDKSSAYMGKFKISDNLPGSDITVGDAILSPTRTYAPVIKAIFDIPGIREKITGIIHCTGGGQTKCMNFGKGISYIKDSLFEIPPLFSALGEAGNISRSEMYRVFNMGHRMEIYCDESAAADIIAAAAKFNVDAKIIGHTEASDGANKLTITDADGTYYYSKD